MSNEFFVLKKFSYMDGICICKGVDEDSRYGAWHVDNHIETCMFYMNV